MATYIGEMQKLVIGDKEYSLPAGGAGTITKVQTTAGAHTAINVSSGAASFNVPTKTSHLTNDSGFLTSHQTLYEANLNWGGKDFSAGYSPIDAAMIDVLGANRFAFLKAAGLTIEYSTDGGTSYTDYGATDAQKVGLFSSGQSFYLGKHTSNGSCTTNDRLRVTIDTGAASVYTVLNKIAIYMSTSDATVQVLIEKALQSTPTTFSTHKDWTGISGWSGWNILNISGLTTYGYSAASQYGRIRFTFRQTAVNTNYTSANISKIMGFGGVGWITPSTMAATGHLYSYDSSQNATFPAKVTATGGFSGALTGNVTGTATGNLTSVQYDSTNAKLTYTKNGSNTDIVTVATLKTALGSMPASDVYSWAKASTKPTYTASEVGAATSTHTHGNITNAGDITATAPTIASGDQIIINDHSASKVTNGPTFDGSTTSKYLSPKGTWETLPQGTAYSAGTGLSLSETTFNHSNSVTAQTTQAVYPIKIDEQGHISAYGSAVTITDQSVLSEPSINAITWYPIGSGSSATETGATYKHASVKVVLTSDSSTSGTSTMALGNTTATTSAGGKRGVVRLYGTAATYYTDLVASAASTNKTITFPNATGTVALTSDIPSAVTESTVSGWGFTKNTGTVTSVGLSSSRGLDISDSPVTTSGTITINNTGVLTVEASPNAASNGTIAVTTGTASGSNTSYVAVKGLAAAAYKEVTDNSSSTAVTSSDTNLITARTLYYAGYTKNAGTVTSVGITNGGGLSISGSPVTDSGNITVGHSNSVTAQTTEAVYPIQIDAQGHISAYGSAVSIPSKISDLTNDKLDSSLFVVEKVSTGIAISVTTSGASGSSTYSKTGYTCLGVVGYDCQGTGVTQCNVYRIYWDGSQVYAYIRTATSTTITVYPYLLWLKTS